MARGRNYTDAQLITAIAVSSSWRGTLRELGLAGTSGAAIRSVRSNADRLGVDVSHFNGKRRWTEEALRAAIASVGSWPEVVECLGLHRASDVSLLKGHAARLRVDTTHLDARPSPSIQAALRPGVSNLKRAGGLLAASWFALCGQDISWPLEPCRYDLLVSTDAGVRRVQVKTTTVRVGETWKVYLSNSRGHRMTYDPDEIDDFFVIDGSLSYYLIPISVVGGLQAIHLNAYESYRVRGAW